MVLLGGIRGDFELAIVRVSSTTMCDGAVQLRRNVAKGEVRRLTIMQEEF